MIFLMLTLQSPVFYVSVTNTDVVCQVVDVEEEMRMLLRETDSSRRLTEEKVKKLSKAFIDLQSDVC